MAMNIMKAMRTKPQPLDFVFPGLIAGTVGALVSPGGSGKSAWAMQACAQIAGAPDLLNLGKTKIGRAVYLAAEDPEIVLEHRLAALGEIYSDEVVELVSHNFIIEPLINYSPDLMSDKWFSWIKAMATGSRVVFIDTLRMFHALEENDSGQMSQVVAKIKLIAAQTGAAIVFLHHTNKAATFGKSGNEQQASRGSSVLVDNIRWQGYLVTMDEKEANERSIDEFSRPYFVQFGISKKNYGKPFKPVWLRKMSAKDEDIEGGFTLQPVEFVGPITKGKGRGNGRTKA